MALIMDEVDGMSSGDRGGMQALIALTLTLALTPTLTLTPTLPPTLTPTLSLTLTLTPTLPLTPTPHPNAGAHRAHQADQDARGLYL